MKRGVKFLLTAVFLSGIAFAEQPDGRCDITERTQEQFIQEDLVISRTIWLVESYGLDDCFSETMEAVKTRWEEIVISLIESGISIPQNLLEDPYFDM